MTRSRKHVGTICDGSATTFLLTEWVRERGLFSIESAVQRLTQRPAALYGFHDRGTLEAGKLADINLIDLHALKILPPQIVRELIGKDMVLGLSTHNPDQIKLAEKSGVVDYLGVGPVYATQTKVDVGEAVGLKYVTYAHEHTKLPFVAIGGIKEHNIHEVAKAGAKTIAVVSDIVGAVDIENKVQKLYQCMDIQV